jgi:peptidylprolyl isomerase
MIRTILIIGLVGPAILAAGCSQGKAAAKGDTVQVQYKGTLGDGSVFDPGDQPLTFTIGKGDVIPGFDAAVTGMRVGESKTVTIPAAEAYGPKRPEAITTVERSLLPDVKDPQVGQTLRASDPEGGMHTAVITAVTDKTITIDENHQLAGKDLTFFIKVVEIK